MRNKVSNIASNDGRFHDGDATTGALGTIVTAEWLNDMQDFSQDTFEELKNVLALGNLTPNSAKKNQVAEAISIALRNVRAVADSNTRTLQNVIPNSKKSNSVASTSSDTVATSYAVKQAYDKAVEAKKRADSSYQVDETNQNRNLTQLLGQNTVWGTAGRENSVLGLSTDIYNYGVGLSMTSAGARAMLYIPHSTSGRNSGVWVQSNYSGNNAAPLWRRIDGADWGEVRNKVLASTSQVGITQLDSSTDSTSETKAATPKAVKIIKDLIDALTRNLANYIPNSKKSNSVSSTSSDTVATSYAVKQAYDKGVSAQSTANSANDNANGRVSKSGDTMTGDLTVPYLRVRRNHAWINLISLNNTGASLDFSVLQDRTAQASVSCQDVGNYASELRFRTTPQGQDYNTDRRHHVMTIGHSGHLWAKPYGWLHDYFVKREDFIRSWYPNHYDGTEVYKIRHLGIMITLMNTTNGAREFNLPEAYDGHAIVLATDRGDGHINVSSNKFLGGNRIRIGGRSDTHCSVLVIGMKNV